MTQQIYTVWLLRKHRKKNENDFFKKKHPYFAVEKTKRKGIKTRNKYQLKKIYRATFTPLVETKLFLHYKEFWAPLSTDTPWLTKIPELKCWLSSVAKMTKPTRERGREIEKEREPDLLQRRTRLAASICSREVTAEKQRREGDRSHGLLQIHGHGLLQIEVSLLPWRWEGSKSDGECGRRLGLEREEKKWRKMLLPIPKHRQPQKFAPCVSKLVRKLLSSDIWQIDLDRYRSIQPRP